MNEYVPVIIGQIVNYHKFDWWDKSFFTYPKMLASAYPNMKDKSFRKNMNISNQYELWGDSGGFTNMRKELNLDNRSVLHWQEQNCDIIFSLDYPPNIKTDNETTRLKKYDKSIKNIEYMIDKKTANKKYYACVHGTNFKELSDYHKKISDLDTDGLAQGQLSNIETNMIQKLDRIVASFYLSDKPLHFLGLSSVPPLSVAFYLQKITGTKFNFDNSSYGIGAIYKQYTITHVDTPGGKESLTINKHTKIRHIPCDCPVCSNATIEDLKAEGSVSGILVSLHNLYTEIKRYEWIKTLVDSPEDLFNYLHLHKRPKNIRNRLEYIFKCKDIEDYVKKYPYRIINQMRL